MVAKRIEIEMIHQDQSAARIAKLERQVARYMAVTTLLCLARWRVAPSLRQRR